MVKIFSCNLCMFIFIIVISTFEVQIQLSGNLQILYELIIIFFGINAIFLYISVGYFIIRYFNSKKTIFSD